MLVILELLEKLPLEDLERIDATCDAFVSARRQGQTLRIEDLVFVVPESLQMLTALELIRTDVEIRREVGEQPTIVEYLARFAQWSHEVHALFSELFGAEADARLQATVKLSLKDTDARSEILPNPSAATPANWTDLLPVSDTPQPNTRLGNYEIHNVLGRGGMGIVVRARDTKLDRDVAIKLLTPELACNESAKERFLREARAAAAVRHDNVVTIHSVDEANGTPFLVMELIVGETLSERLKREGPLPATEVARLGIQIASGLDAAHRRGLIHRDIKPANILLEVGWALMPVRWRWDGRTMRSQQPRSDGQVCPSSEDVSC